MSDLVPVRFEERARLTPGSVAVECGGELLTYGELNRSANRLAHHLRGQGVEAEERVGVRLGRTVELAVAVLGVLKAGAAYLPLDPEYPAERLESMRADASARVVVTEETLAACGGCAESDPEPRVGGGSLAYVIYTSGSTGRPKGVMVEHRTLSEVVSGAVSHYGLGSGDRV